MSALDVEDVDPDLQAPTMQDQAPAAERRVRHTLPGWGAALYHSLFLPAGWRPGESWPVVVEYAGNGPHTSRHKEFSSGRLEDSCLGYGLTAGRGCIWLCLPYLNNAGELPVTWWWGDPPDRDPAPTVAYCREAIAMACHSFGGDAQRVLICGFSRGSLACTRLGLHDPAVAALWRGFLLYSHMEGVRTWDYDDNQPGGTAYPAAATGRTPGAVPPRERCRPGYQRCRAPEVRSGHRRARGLHLSGDRVPQPHRYVDPASIGGPTNRPRLAATGA